MRLVDLSVLLQQSILGEQREGGGVGEEQRHPEPPRQPQEAPHGLLWGEETVTMVTGL